MVGRLKRPPYPVGGIKRQGKLPRLFSYPDAWYKGVCGLETIPYHW
jgi:hypothetical protein